MALATPALGAERWGWLGVRIRDLSESEMEDLSVKLGLREGYGVLIAEVLKDGPAEGVDLRAGDLVVTIAGRPVVETRALQRIVGESPAGRELTLVVLRDGRRREVRLRVGEMPHDVVAERVAAEFGFFVRDGLTQDPTSPAGRRPLVVAVGERTPAARAGLATGDRILTVGGAEVLSLEAFRARMGQVRLSGEMRLRVERRGEQVDLVLPPVRPAGPPQ